MKKTVFLLIGLLYFVVYNTMYAQYFDVKQETPRGFVVVAVTNAIKTGNKYYFVRGDWPDAPKRAFYSTTTHREYYYPTFSAIDALKGDSLFSISPISLDTNHARQILYMDTLGSDFIGFGADLHKYGPIGSMTDYDFRAAVLRVDKNGQLKWYKLVGDSLNGSGVVTWDKHIIACGVYATSNAEALLVGLDSLGRVQWKKTYHRGFASAIGKLIQTKPNELYGLGAIDFNISSSWTDDTLKLWLTKLNTNGDLLYEKVIDIPEPGYVRSDGNDAIRAKNGDFIVGGRTFAPYPDLRTKLLLFRTDSLGNVKWHKITEAYGNYDAGIISSVREQKDGRIWAVALNNHPWFLSCPVCPKWRSVIWLYNLDSAGNRLWQRCWLRSNIVFIAGRRWRWVYYRRRFRHILLL